MKILTHGQRHQRRVSLGGPLLQHLGDLRGCPVDMHQTPLQSVESAAKLPGQIVLLTLPIRDLGI